MPETPTSASGSSWFQRPWFQRRGPVLLVGAVVLVLLVGLLAWRTANPVSRLHPDLGPGPVRGVRLTEFAPGEGSEACLGVTADLPVVRLVAQVDVERLTLCLGPGRLANTLPLEPYVLDATSENGEQLLDTWAAAWSLGGYQPPWWQSEEIACPAIATIYPSSAITVAGVTLRPVPPFGPCQPLPEALAALDAVAQAARPA